VSLAAPNAFRLLLGHEFRLYLRSGSVKGISLVFLIITQVLLHLLALAIALATRSPQARLPAGLDTGLVMLSSGLFAMLLLMVSRSLAGAVQSLYTRGDLDLLLASPVDRRAVIGVRMAALALTVMMEVALLVWPFANVFVLFGRVAWAKAYLLIPAMALLATSIGLAVTLLSFRTLGPKRTRLAVQVLAVVIGMGMMLAVYLPGALRDGPSRGPVYDGVALLAQHPGGWRDLLTAPAQWVMNGYLPTAAFFLAAALLFATTIHLVGDRLVTTLTTITGGGTRRIAARSTGELRIRGSFRTLVILKELRLIARDPFLVAQILQQSLMVLPISIVLWRSGAESGLPIPWFAVIVLAGGLASPLAWLTVLAEDAPDLLASAPVSRAALVRAKIEAALLPVLPICLLPLPFLLFSWPWFALCTSFCATGAALSAALLNMRNPVARRRDSFKTRHKGSAGRGLLEVVSLAFWVLLCVGLVLGARALAGWR